MEVTILMPCLNESAGISRCIQDAFTFLQSRKIPGEVLIADNGSTDGSRELALAAGAEVITVSRKGYGNAILSGIHAAKGRYIIIGDCDGSYDFTNLDGILEQLRQGYHLVVGNRFSGGIAPDAMPFSHRYFGVPFLSWLGRCRFGVDIGDFHCGLRGVSRAEVRSAELRCGGMEFATEMIGRFAQAGFRICQVPVPLYPDLRHGPGHLRTFRDGLRHLLLILFWNHT